MRNAISEDFSQNSKLLIQDIKPNTRQAGRRVHTNEITCMHDQDDVFIKVHIPVSRGESLLSTAHTNEHGGGRPSEELERWGNGCTDLNHVFWNLRGSKECRCYNLNCQFVEVHIHISHPTSPPFLLHHFVACFHHCLFIHNTSNFSCSASLSAASSFSFVIEQILCPHWKPNCKVFFLVAWSSQNVYPYSH